MNVISPDQTRSEKKNLHTSRTCLRIIAFSHQHLFNSVIVVCTDIGTLPTRNTSRLFDLRLVPVFQSLNKYRLKTTRFICCPQLELDPETLSLFYFSPAWTEDYHWPPVILARWCGRVDLLMWMHTQHCSVIHQSSAVFIPAVFCF